jgi:hypothetical protein
MGMFLKFLREMGRKKLLAKMNFFVLTSTDAVGSVSCYLGSF